MATRKKRFEGGYCDPPTDFAKEAETAGTYGENVRDPAELGAALERGRARVRNRDFGVGWRGS